MGSDDTVATASSCSWRRLTSSCSSLSLNQIREGILTEGAVPLDNEFVLRDFLRTATRVGLGLAGSLEMEKPATAFGDEVTMEAKLIAAAETAKDLL
mmetsp:Transcript_5398/g.7422  ORF Transcript_5398/g.7422 Transcript_5398/m.7422 type:complete len:97 (+) Transcript_5398:889-1179(+)